MPLRRTCPVILLAVVAALRAEAERLPVTAYSSAQGLASDDVSTILSDAQGFLWFGTSDGLSRFDGAQFVTFGVLDGLPGPSIKKLAETSDHRICVVGSGGFAWTRQPARAGEPRFETIPIPDAAAPAYVNDMWIARDGRVVLATMAGAFVLDPQTNPARATPLDPAPAGPATALPAVHAVLAARSGSVWLALDRSLVRREPSGLSTAWPTPEGVPLDPGVGWHTSFFEDHAGRVWVASAQGGLWLLAADPAPGQSVVERIFTERDGLPFRQVRAFLEDSDGTMWFATPRGLACAGTGTARGGMRFSTVGEVEGLSDREVWALARDDAGNLWLGSRSAGAMRIAASGMTSWDEQGGTPAQAVQSLLLARDGRVFAVMGDQLYGVEGSTLRVWPIRHSGVGLAWVGKHIVIQDHTGRWWVSMQDGLARFRASDDLRVLSSAPERIFAARDGIGPGGTTELAEDAGGDIWVGLGQGGLCRWRRATDHFECFSENDGVPRSPPVIMTPDHAGSMWIGFNDGTLARYRNGRFTARPIPATDAAPLLSNPVMDIACDGSGGIWVARYRGELWRIDEPAADDPGIARVTWSTARESTFALSLAGDDLGRICIGTRRGVYRFAPSDGSVLRLTSADGLSSNTVWLALNDHHGNLWFGTTRGLSRLRSNSEAPPRQTTVYITGVRIAGADRALDQVITANGASLKLDSDDRSIEVTFTAPSFRAGETMRFQTKLGGAGEGWAPPSLARSVSYANLAPGRYRFQVRAVDSRGRVSETPAGLSFVLPPPVWRRWWFLAAVCGLAMATGWSILRLRMRHIVDLERVRAGIATDLHDDIGASLSQIAIVSEVARRAVERGEGSAEAPLAGIARSAREMVDGMSDLVWAVDPQRDTVPDLLQRMRRFAEEISFARGIVTQFEYAGPSGVPALDPRVRRAAFLAFKESVNNAVKHSGCGRLRAVTTVADGSLTVSVTDDGTGFDSGAARDGNGLPNLRRRAEGLGGTCSIDSETGRGTAVVFRIPLRSPRVPWRPRRSA